MPTFLHRVGFCCWNAERAASHVSSYPQLLLDCQIPGHIYIYCQRRSERNSSFVRNSSSRQNGWVRNSAIKSLINFRGTVQWIWRIVLTPGREQGLLVPSICVWIRSSKKIWGKDGEWADGKGGTGAVTGCQFGKTQQCCSETHLCIHVLTFTALLTQEKRNQHFPSFPVGDLWNGETHCCLAEFSGFVATDQPQH